MQDMMQCPMYRASLRVVQRDLEYAAVLARAAKRLQLRARRNMAALDARVAAAARAPAGKRDKGGRTSPRRRKAAQSARGAVQSTQRNKT